MVITSDYCKISCETDKHLGGYIKDKTGADMVLWDGSCIVHEEFKAKELMLMKKANPGAAVLVHPESQLDVVKQADVVGSTSLLLKSVTDTPLDKSRGFLFMFLFV